ncbi:MAG: TetR/AcrR family transcriptional regulator [Ktedonobacteraceae bacterium]|nr:TetR/AcrR family transcriptional regulator [Ktedonobacteraceae bacterium]
MVKGKARERRQARTREAIVQAAEEIIEAQGPDALNMRDVAERIDYSASNLYEYFSGKDELLAAVIEEALTRLVMHVRSIPTDLSARERLLSYGHMYLEFAHMHPQLYLLTFGRKAEHVNPTNLDGNPYSLLLQIVEEGLAEGVFVPRPDFGLHEMAFGCWSLVHGIAMLRLTLPSMAEEKSSEGDNRILESFVNGISLS